MIKNAKNDTRYIVKRIIIGVGIALILGFIKANNVLAEEKNVLLNIQSYNSFSFNFDTSNNYFFEDLRSPFSGINYNYYLNNNFNESSYLILYDNNNNSYLYFFFHRYYSDYPISVKDINLSFVDNGSNNSYYAYEYKCVDSSNSSLGCLDSSSSLSGYMRIGGYNSTFILSDSSNLDYSNITSQNLVKFSESNNSTDYFYTYYSAFNITQNILSNFSVYDTNLDSLSINGIDIPIPVAPPGFSQIDLTDYNAVYFLPKDYSTIPTREVDNHVFIDFSFYFKGGVNYGYFNLVNNEQIVFLPLFDNLSSSTDFILVESSFPMFYDDTDSNLDDLNAFIIYNTGGVTQVSYNNNLFDYYLIKDLNSYSQEITYIDNLGNSVTKTITFTQTLEEMWESGFSQDSNNWWNAGFKNKDKLNNYIQLLKLPYRLFVLLYNKIIGGICTDFIIPFPHLGNIRVTCLSVVFRNVLGNNFFSAFKILINTFYVIAIVFANVKFLMKQLSPELIWFGNNL